MYEARVVVERFADQWYPAGSDTPIPASSVIEIYDGGVHGSDDLTDELI